MIAVIMAGGKGTRLQSIAKDIPKPMIPVLGKPILEYQIESLKRSGVKKLTLIVGYLGHVIAEYFGDGSRWGVTIDYVIESKPLGTAGALFYLQKKINDDFFLVFGDLLLDIDWKRFMEFHKKRRACITLYGHPNAHPYDSDVIVADDWGRVQRILFKNTERNFYYHNFVNAGIYCVNPHLLQSMKGAVKTDFEKELLVKNVKKETVYAYRSTEYIKDMGTPERLCEVERDVSNGIVKDRSLRRKQKAIFLDRDGTINILKGFLKSADEFELLPGVADAIKKINKSGYLAIVATNQPVIARGECSFQELEEIHMKMETELGKEGAYLDDLFFCPHHPHKGYAGEVSYLKFDCSCRKPKIGMLMKAAEKYNIDLKHSWYVGDTTSDILAGINAGMGTVLVCTGEAGRDKKYNVAAKYEAENLSKAVTLILSEKM